MKHLYDDLSRKISKLVTNQYSTSFSFSTRLIAKQLRPAIYSVYGLVRLADEVVDSFHSYDKKKLIERLKDDYSYAIENRISLNPILNSFQEAYHKYNFDPYLVDNFFHSMDMDLTPKEYTNELYNEYIHGSAEVIGLMCLKIFVKGNDKKYLELKDSAMRLGSAFQKVNFLRDLEYDKNQLGRTYFPEIDFNNISSNQKNQIIKDIEEDFNLAMPGMRRLDRDSFLGVYVAFRYYRELLNKIKKTKLSNLKKVRIRISNFRKFSIILSSAIKTNLGIL